MLLVENFTCHTNKDFIFDLYSVDKDFVFINFWSTWCHFCVQELCDLQKLYEKYNKDVYFIFINCGESKTYVDDFMQKNNHNFIVGYDEKNALSSKFNIMSIPRTIIINGKHNIVEDIVGAKDFNGWESIITKYIRQ